MGFGWAPVWRCYAPSSSASCRSSYDPLHQLQSAQHQHEHEAATESQVHLLHLRVVAAMNVSRQTREGIDAALLGRFERALQQTMEQAIDFQPEQFGAIVNGIQPKLAAKLAEFREHRQAFSDYLVAHGDNPPDDYMSEAIVDFYGKLANDLGHIAQIAIIGRFAMYVGLAEDFDIGDAVLEMLQERSRGRPGR